MYELLTLRSHERQYLPEDYASEDIFSVCWYLLIFSLKKEICFNMLYFQTVKLTTKCKYDLEKINRNLGI